MPGNHVFLNFWHTTLCNDTSLGFVVFKSKYLVPLCWSLNYGKMIKLPRWFGYYLQHRVSLLTGSQACNREAEKLFWHEICKVNCDVSIKFVSWNAKHPLRLEKKLWGRRTKGMHHCYNELQPGKQSKLSYRVFHGKITKNDMFLKEILRFWKKKFHP